MPSTLISLRDETFESLTADIPFIKHVVHHDQLMEDSVALLAKVFPEWDSKDLKLAQCKDGITNKLVACRNTKLETTVLVRAYGKNSEKIIDRKHELQTMAGLARLSLCPRLYARFDNGLVYGYIPGRVVQPAEMGTPHVSKLIAVMLARWHMVDLPGSQDPQLFITLNNWLNDIPDTFSNPNKQKQFVEQFNMNEIKAELELLESELTLLDSPVVFSHNDLLSANVIYNEETDEISFIDYEYGTYNFRGFDIANHFCEYAGFECDYSRYPSKEAQIKWFRTYLEKFSQSIPKEKELESLYIEVSKFSLASHFYWGLWALVQASISDIDFDYMTYARMRFDEYYKNKEAYLAL
ncbi:hypothetical protein H4219_003203 [Mycoemilia scoparia]|uniref:ethanolamine kinase n=1 Tax=Mycoemilia scoparia TaxID=417184 RepID=A0A9W8DT10_9FUNG|nr:hypothetical protein H4219_003203 [Mycoemilia scoparia]